MRLRVGTFNVENLLTRHRFGTQGRADTSAAMSLFHFPRADERDAVERSLAVALEDDMSDKLFAYFSQSRLSIASSPL